MTNKHDKNLLARVRGGNGRDPLAHRGTKAVIDGETKIQIDVGGNVLESLADFRALPDDRFARLKHALVGGLMGLGQKIDQVAQGLMPYLGNLNDRLIAVEEVLVALNAEGKVPVADPVARLALQRIEQTVFARKMADAQAKPAATSDEQKTEPPADGETPA